MIHDTRLQHAPHHVRFARSLALRCGPIMTCGGGWKLSVLAALLLGCGGRGLLVEQASDGGAPPAAADTGATPPAAADAGVAPPIPAAACITDPDLPAGAVVIACGFAPNLTLIGADAEAVYALTAAGQFYRIDTATRLTTLLYAAPNPDNPDNLPAALATVVSGGRIYFASHPTSDPNTFGVLSLDATQPSQPEVVVPSGAAGGPPVVLGSSIYYEHDDGSALDAVYGAPVTGGAGSLLSQGDAWPVAGVDGFVYIAVPPPNSGVGSPYGQLVRVPAGGGAPSVVIDTLDTSGGGDGGDGCLAVDSSSAYMLGAADAGLGDPVERYSLFWRRADHARQRAQRRRERFSIGAPLASARRRRAYLYFLQTVEALRSLSQLERVSSVQAMPSQTPDVLMEGYVMGAPPSTRPRSTWPTSGEASRAPSRARSCGSGK